MKKYIITIFGLLLLTKVSYGAPSSLMTIAPPANDEDVIEADDENDRNTTISTPYNAHTHNGLIAENTLVVGSTNAEYSTIQSALNAAAANDVILVNEGTYTEAVTFTQNNITLKALGSMKNTIITQAAATVVNFSSYNGCILEGFTVSVTAADGLTDYVINNSNDHASDYNIIKNCNLTWASSVSIGSTTVALYSNDGSMKYIDCDVDVNHTYAAGSANDLYAIRFETANVNAELINTNITVNSDGTATNSIYAVRCDSGNLKIEGGSIVVTSDAATTGDVEAISAGSSTSLKVFNVDIDVEAVSTATAIVLGGATTNYVIGCNIDGTTADGDAQWWSGGTTLYASGNSVTGDCVYADATNDYIASLINGQFVNGEGDKTTTATEVGAMFWDGIVIGTDNDNNILDDATHGAGVGTLYLGNATVDATFTGFHYYKLGDTDLKAGELVKLANDKLYRSTIKQDPTVIGLFCGLTNWKDSLGNTLIDGKEIEEKYYDDKEKKEKIRKKKDYGQPINVATNKPVQPLDYSYSVAIVGDSRHENETNPLLGAWVSVSAGTIKNGDLLCSSSKAGYLELQPDDILHSYTVAQAREDINSDKKNAYIYLLQ